MELFYATTNEGKVKSLQKRLHPYAISVIQRKLTIPELQSDSVEEIAKQKANDAYRRIRQPIVTLDAAFEIASLGGFPGTNVKSVLENEKMGLTALLKLVEQKARDCAFKHSIAYRDAQLKEPIVFTDTVHGVLTDERRGELQPHLWSPLALVFIPRGYDKTLAEMTRDEYYAWQRSPSNPDDESAKTYHEQLGSWLVENRIIKH